MTCNTRPMFGLLAATALLGTAMGGPAYAAPEKPIDVSELTVRDIQQALESGRYSAEQLTQAVLERIARYEPSYNAFIALNPKALAEARAVDAARSAGKKAGPLAGVPFVVKDSMDAGGMPTTAGWSLFASSAGGVDLIPRQDAPVVERLRAAGAILIGKTNLPPLSWSNHADDSWTGPTYNAVNRALSPGGSSSGSATAIAASMAVIALGEETGGSIQNPAGAQSIAAIKPSFGLVPNSGMVPFASSTLDTIGPMARTVADVAAALDALAGYSADDLKTLAAVGHLPKGGFSAYLSATSLNGARIGLFGPGWRKEAMSQETQALFANAVSALQARGATVVEDPFEGSGFSDLEGYTNGWVSGAETVAFDMDGYFRHLGPDAAVKSLAQMRALPGGDIFADEKFAKSYADMPVLRESLKDPGVAPDMSAHLALRDRYLAIFRDVMQRHRLDAMLFPQSMEEYPALFSKMPTKAPTVVEINIPGLPGVVVPAGHYRSGSPFALVFVGDLFSDAQMLSFAYDYEQATRHRIVPVLSTEPPPKR